MKFIATRISNVKSKQLTELAKDKSISIYELIRLAIDNILSGKIPIINETKELQRISKELEKTQSERDIILKDSAEKIQNLQKELLDHKAFFNLENPNTKSVINEIISFALFYNKPNAPKRLSTNALEFALKYQYPS